MSSYALSVPGARAFLERVAYTPVASNAPSSSHVHHHYHTRDYSYYPSYPIFNMYVGPTNAAAVRAENEAAKAALAVVIGSIAVIGGALLSGNFVRNTVDRVQNYAQSKDIFYRAHIISFDRQLASLAYLMNIAESQISLDTTELRFALAYLTSLVSTIASGSFLLIAGAFASQAFIAMGTVALVGSLALGAFTWSFDDPSRRAVEQLHTQAMARQLLNPTRTSW